MDKPVINILTRTSNRPNGFDINYQSIHGQTYDNIKHIVAYDNDSDLEYIKNCGDITTIKIDRQGLIDNDQFINPNTGKYSPHNMYFNEMIKEVDEGWIIYLDDDDTFTHSMVIQQIVKEINNADDDTLFVWKFKLGTSLILPKTFSDEQPPRLGGIGGSCMGFHIKHKDLAIWDSWKCSDFRVIDRLYKGIPNHKFINKLYVNAPVPGSGNKVDLKT